MTVQHVSVCDACGSSAPARSVDGVDWTPPAEWITVGSASDEDVSLQFCTWTCVGVYITQRIREHEVAAHVEPPALCDCDSVDLDPATHAHDCNYRIAHKGPLTP